jgi:hypothetical protein
MPDRTFPPALSHGALREVLPNIHFVTGTVAMPGPLPVRFSRNMTIVREGERLVLINSIRLDDAGLRELDKLGKVTDVIRLAANHGLDDPFYQDRYGAKVWAVEGQRYTSGFDTKKTETYFEPDAFMSDGTELPLSKARLYLIHSTPPEALLILDDVIVAGDCLQNWGKSDAYFTLLAKMLMPLMGFMKPHNIGPGWLKQCNPPKDDLRKILDLEFVNVLPAHGEPVLGKARELYRAAIERVSS